MPNYSLHKTGVSHVLRFSVLYSLIIMAGLIIISFKGLQAEKEKQIEDIIERFLNSYEGGSVSKNLPLAIQKLQQKTNLQEILIYNDKCQLLSGTALILKNICVHNNKNFKSLRIDLGNSRYLLFYHSNFFFKDHFKDFAFKTLSGLTTIFLITSLVLYTFLYFTVLRPLQQMGKTIESSQSAIVPKELSFFQSKIINLKEQLLKNEEERTYLKTSKKVIHDIRNPLLYLRRLIEDENFSSDELLDNLDDVDFQIRSILERGENSVHELTLGSFFSLFKQDCQVMFNLAVEISDFKHKSVVVILDPRHLKNILLNFARNSSEAKASKLLIEYKISEGYFELHVRDDGHGIHENIKELVLRNQFSTKSNGNGIGLFSAKEKLNAIGGDLLLHDSLNGAYFIFKIPLFNSGPEIALIDDDKFIHASWKSKADENCFVHTFFSIEEFFEAKLSKKILVFVDSDLGYDNPGELEAKRIYSAGYQNIYLATNFCDIKVSDYPWIKSLVPKSGPFTRTT